MEKRIIGGYDNSGCVRNDSFHETAAIEMARIVAGGKCCADVSSDRNDDGTPRNLSDVVALSSACQPKCPAVKKSPWDPIKTRFAVLLVVLMILWIAVGVIAVNFGFSL